MREFCNFMQAREIPWPLDTRPCPFAGRRWWMLLPCHCPGGDVNYTTALVSSPVWLVNYYIGKGGPNQTLPETFVWSPSEHSVPNKTIRMCYCVDIRPLSNSTVNGQIILITTKAQHLDERHGVMTLDLSMTCGNREAQQCNVAIP